ncbi:hypothetical protein VTK73DRAFT_2321 [Phialemonium thermophilum]|uniref:Uncharacterized protein n=1 Tax=Phialemonium thermophilum TaxID=223376 RepID=A0ABR3VSA0_9PEZI
MSFGPNTQVPQVCARAATRYFSVDTKHVRKQSGLEVGDILRDFYERAVQMFNLKDPGGLLAQPSMLSRVLAAALEPRQLGLVEDSMKDTDAAAVPVATTTTTSPKLVDGLSPHDRACLLVVAVAEILLVFHKLGEMQALRSGSRRNGAGGVSLTERRIEATLREVAAGTERVAVRETVEASRVFTQGFALGEVAELIARAVEQAERGDAAAGGSSSSRGGGGGRAPRSLVVEDDSELEEISLHFVNDRGPDETVLPNGMRVLVLN